MYHISANLSVRSTRKKYLGVQKAPGGQANKKNRKKSGDLFIFFNIFFWRQSKICGGRQKMSRGAPNGNVTPLGQTFFGNIFFGL